MSYLGIINLIFLVISTLLGIYTFYYIFFAILATFHKRKYPEAKEKCRYAVVISAKDEENVISRVINSIRDNDYPQDKIDIYVIAHNCKDKTGEVAASLGANVIVYNDPQANYLGYAYHYAIPKIDIAKYDGVVVFNADNTLKKDYFNKINDVFVYHNKSKAVTSFRASLNTKDGVIPALYAYYFAIPCSLAYLGRENLNVSSRITGCGFVVPSSYLANGWNYTSITEDIEFSGDQVLKGEIIRYADDAIFYDEQPYKFKTMWFQRLRWARGLNINSRKFFPKLLKALFSKNKKNRMSLYAELTFHSFLPLTFFSIFILQMVLFLISPLFNVPLNEAFFAWNMEKGFIYNIFFNMNLGGMYILIKSIVSFFVSSYVTLIFVLIASRGKFKGEPVIPMILAFILFPFFVFLQIPLDLNAMVVRNLKWKKVPHGNN